MRIPITIRLTPVAAVALALCACSSGGGSPSPVLPGISLQSPTLKAHRAMSSGKIQHIVIIVQENRSFNNLFYGFPGAHTAKFGYDQQGNKIQLQPVGLETTWDIDHSFGSFLAACDGTGSYPGTGCKMDGFDNEYVGCGNHCPNSNPPYSYVPHNETKPYFFLGKHYVLADEMYASNVDASSFISHQYIIAGQASSAVNYPSNYWGCPGVKYGDQIATLTQAREYGSNINMCWDNQTLGDEMDTAGLSWAYYAFDLVWRRRHLERLPEHQPHLQRTRLGQRRHLAADEFLQRRPERETARPDLGHADLRQLRSRGLRRQERSLMGRVARQRDRPISVLEQHRDLHLLGRLRRLVRSEGAEDG